MLNLKVILQSLSAYHVVRLAYNSRLHHSLKAYKFTTLHCCNTVLVCGPPIWWR